MCRRDRDNLIPGKVVPIFFWEEGERCGLDFDLVFTLYALRFMFYALRSTPYLTFESGS